jgi:tetratricopeptide (TPR) repeat protein
MTTGEASPPSVRKGAARGARSAAAAVLLVALAAAGGLLSCGGDDLARRPLDLGTRAVVIGIDGADWRLIDRLIEEGRMPHMARLKARSAWGPIETLHDVPLSPVIWTSVATGKTADQHGIAWFMVDRPDGTRVPVRSTNRRAKALWNVLAEHGRRPVVVGWWATYPAEEVGEGAIVSDALGFHGFGATARRGDDGRKTYPPGLYREVARLVPPEEQVSADFARRFIDIPPDEYRREMYTPARQAAHDAANPIHLFQMYAATAQGYTAIAEELLAERPFDLFLLYYEQVDSLSHLFMKHAPPRLPWIDAAEHRRYGGVVDEWYAYQDELLGRLLARIDLEETALFVLSDHGFKSGERRIRAEGTVDVARAHLDHEPDGIFLAAGPHLRRASVRDASVLDVAPTLLHYLGFPVARDMKGRVLEEIFEPAFLDRNPVRHVATYESPAEEGGEGGGDAPAEAPPADSELAEANLEALRSLGYLGGGTGGGAAGEGSSPEIHNNLGRIHFGQGDLPAARREFERALELDPESADALLNLASLHAAEGRTAQARHLVERALAVDPSSTAALAQLAELARDRGDLPEAIRLFREGLAIDRQPFLFLGLGDVLQRAGRLDEAVAAFESALELDPDSALAYYDLGVTYGNQGRHGEAVAAYEKALALEPHGLTAAKTLNNLGAMAQEEGDLATAGTFFEQAVAAAPGHLESRYNLAVIRLGAGRVEEAVALLEEAAELAPNHELVTLRLAQAYLAANRGEDAYRRFLLVRRLYPRNWEAPLGLALLHASAGQPEEARRQLDDAIERGGAAARAAARERPALRQLLDRG